MLLSLLFAGLGCQVRESGDTTINLEPTITPLEWYAHVVTGEDSYGVRLQWSPAVPATLTRQKRVDSGDWVADGTMVVSEVPEDGTFWKAESNTEYRFTIASSAPHIDFSHAPKFLYTKIPEDRVVVDENNVFVQTPPSLSLGVAKLPESGRFEFTGGNSEVYAEQLELTADDTLIRFFNEGKPKSKNYNFRIFAGRTSGKLEVEIGPFDPEGPAPVIDLSVGYGGERVRFVRKGTQHPKQQIRLRQEGEVFYFVGDALINLEQYEGLYRAKKNPERSIGGEFMIVASDGKFFRLWQDHSKKWEVIQDLNFYPALVDFSQYDKVEWADNSVPEIIRNVKAVQNEIKALSAKWTYHVHVNYALTDLYDDLPDLKQTAVLKEMNRRAKEIRRELILTGNDDVIFNNTHTKSPNVMFFRSREPIHFLGIGLNGTPKEIVDTYLSNLREARKEFKEN